jgi:hypothetical protein
MSEQNAQQSMTETNEANAETPAPPPSVEPKSDEGGSIPSPAIFTSATENRILNTENSAVCFPRSPNETPRAYSAFMTFFQFGHGRTLQAVADKLGEKVETIRKWSSKFNWPDRIQTFNAGVLQQHAAAEATTLLEQAAERSARMAEMRQLEWTAVQKLLSGIHCYLEGYGEEQLEKMTLAQVARTLDLTSSIGRKSIEADPLEKPTEPQKSQVEIQLTESLRRVLGNRSSASPAADAN